MAIQKEKHIINLNETIYIERNILGLSEVLTQDFHYNYIKTWW